MGSRTIRFTDKIVTHFSVIHTFVSVDQQCETRHFSYLIPTRDEWKSNPEQYSGEIDIFTDGSKLDGKVGCGIFSEDVGLNESFRLPNYCSVFQAEVLALKHAADELIKMNALGKSINILSDSQAAIRALSSSHTNSKVVQNCLQSLNEIASRNSINIIWIPGHDDHAGNCKADELARLGTTKTNISASSAYSIPIASCKTLIDIEFKKLAETRWHNEIHCIKTKQTFPQYNRRRSRTLINLQRPMIQKVVSLLTGHILLGRHATRLNIPSSDLCPHCEDEDEELTTEHLLCHCPGLAKTRLSNFRKPILKDLTEIAHLDISEIARFSKAIKWLEHFPTQENQLIQQTSS